MSEPMPSSWSVTAASQLRQEALDEMTDDFSTSLLYMSRSIRPLRTINLQVANEISREVNRISDIFMAALAEAQRPPSPLPPPQPEVMFRGHSLLGTLAADHPTGGVEPRLGRGPAVPPGFEHLAHRVLELRESLGLGPDGFEPEPEPSRRQNRVRFELPGVVINEVATAAEPAESEPVRTSPSKDKGKGKAKELVIATGSGHGGTTGPWTPAPADGFPADADDLAETESSDDIPQATQSQYPQGASWARVAALSDADINRMVPSRGVAIPVVSTKSSSGPSQPQEAGSNDRVIWLSPLPDTEPPISLKRISAVLPHMGALHSIAFFSSSPPTHPPSQITRSVSCRIIFHETEAAEKLQRDPPQAFPFSGIVHAGAMYTDVWISALDAGARRRLIIVRRALLTPAGQLTEAEFNATIERLAGDKSQIESVLVYNVGNIAVTFASVEVAAAVKQGLERLSRREGARHDWDGVQVGYSRDPCETASDREVRVDGITSFAPSTGRGASVWKGGRGGRGGRGGGRQLRGGSRWATR